MKYCIKCGNKNSLSANFCQKCGKPFGEVAAQTQEKSKQEPQKPALEAEQFDEDDEMDGPNLTSVPKISALAVEIYTDEIQPVPLDGILKQK